MGERHRYRADGVFRKVAPQDIVVQYLEGMNSQVGNKVSLTCAAVVAVSTAAIPYVTGYGTRLFQLVVLGAFAIVARLSSQVFADQHHSYLWIVAFLLNMVGFSVVAIPLWLLSRRRLRNWGPVLTVCWTVSWIAMLFILFPATDGP
jgi:hypothetical protein